MAESALPYPTPTRLRLADSIAVGQILHYHWINPWTCDTARDRNVTARVAELVAARLAEIPDPPDDLPESYVRLTPEGMAWVTRARTAEATKCERCDNRPAVSRCCSSHDKNLCHRCYRITHFVEVCSKTCALCAAEGLPKVLTGGSKIDIRGPGSTSPEPGPPVLEDEPGPAALVPPPHQPKPGATVQIEFGGDWKDVTDLLKAGELTLTRGVPRVRNALGPDGPPPDEACNCDGEWWGGEHVTGCPLGPTLPYSQREAGHSTEDGAPR
jgi:hypothetical protein